MRSFEPQRSLEQQALELERLNLPGAKLARVQGKEIRYCFEISPSEYSPLYRCLLVVPRTTSPQMYVIKPDLVVKAGSKRPPHIYGHSDGKTQLCLWWPKKREWTRGVKFIESYIAWTAEWLWHYEYWLSSGKWEGGGAHPPERKEKG